MSDSAILIMLLGLGAGMVGYMAGVGGGIIITPVLVIYFGVPILHAIGASLIAVIATSTATSAVQLKQPLADLRLGMVLELATTVGAITAALVVARVDRQVLAGLFAAVLLVMASTLVRRAWKARLEPSPTGVPAYQVRNYGAGLWASLVAGSLSGLLGIGGGPVKVPVMYMYMGIPLRVATATSNFMIGVTAAASVGVYLQRGYLDPGLAMPVTLGVLIGSLVGARILVRADTTWLRWVFTGVIVALALEMIRSALRGEM
jgi:uncharacterized membrane protein YfcA